MIDALRWIRRKQKAADGDEDFVQIPGIAEPTLPPLQFGSVARAELLTLLANRFVGNVDPSRRRKIFDIAKTQRETVVQPDGVTDDPRQIAVSSVRTRQRFHPRSLHAGPLM